MTYQRKESFSIDDMTGQNAYQRANHLYLPDCPRPKARDWTDDDDYILQRGLAEGLSRREIGNKLGRTEKSIHGRVSRLTGRRDASISSDEFTKPLTRRCNVPGCRNTFETISVNEFGCEEHRGR